MYETTEAKERRDRAEGKTSRRGKQLGKRWVLEVLVCLSLLSFVISFLCGAVRWGGDFVSARLRAFERVLLWALGGVHRVVQPFV